MSQLLVSEFFPYTEAPLEQFTKIESGLPNTEAVLAFCGLVRRLVDEGDTKDLPIPGDHYVSQSSGYPLDNGFVRAVIYSAPSLYGKDYIASTLGIQLVLEDSERAIARTMSIEQPIAEAQARNWSLLPADRRAQNVPEKLALFEMTPILSDFGCSILEASAVTDTVADMIEIHTDQALDELTEDELFSIGIDKAHDLMMDKAENSNGPLLSPLTQLPASRSFLRRLNTFLTLLADSQ